MGRTGLAAVLCCATGALVPAAGRCATVAHLTVSAVVEPRCATSLDGREARSAASLVRCDGVSAYSAERETQAHADRALPTVRAAPSPSVVGSPVAAPKDGALLVITY